MTKPDAPIPILVTGGLGFIGSHTAVALYEAGFWPVLVDNLSNSRREVLQGIASITGKTFPFIEGDLRDAGVVRSIFEAHPDIAGVIHFAAFKAVGESVEKPLDYYENNLITLIHLLRELHNRGKGNLVFSSSCTVYGQADALPVAEDAPVKPAKSPYGNTKQIGEEIIRDTVAATGMNVIALRYFNPIGAHPSASIGELPLGVPQNLVPFITQSVAGLRGELAVYGNDYPTRDGTAIRDYIHVMDLAEAHVAALHRMIRAESDRPEPYEVFNIGTGKGSTVLEVIRTFEVATGLKVPHRMAERRAGDVTAAWAETSRAEKVLGWKAQRSLAEALLDAWRWQVEQETE